MSNRAERRAKRGRVTSPGKIPAPPKGHPAWHYWWDPRKGWFHHDERIIEYIDSLNDGAPS